MCTQKVHTLPMLNNAKKQYTDATVVFKNKHKNGAQTGRQKQSTHSPNSTKLRLTAVLSTSHCPYKAAKVPLFKES